MKVLQICNKSPYPPKEGGPIAMNAITEGLIAARHTVKILAVNTPKYFIKNEDIPTEYKKTVDFETVFINTNVKWFDALLNLFSSKSYHVQRFVSDDFSKRLKEILKTEKFDIIQLETLYVSPYIEIIRKYSEAPVVLRSHNVEYLIWEKLAKACSNPLKSLYLNHLLKKLKAYEISMISKYDGICAITKSDADFYKKIELCPPITDIPFGVNASKNSWNDREMEFPSLFHLGSMDWLPNIEGVNWFLNNVWEDVHKRFPSLKLYLAGRNMPDELFNANYPNVEIVGEVDDAADFMLSKAVMIVPLFSGSGIRIKIIEGMCLGKAIISTKKGAEGINCTPEKNILIAGNKEEFIENIAKCIEDKTFCNNIGKEAKVLMFKEYDLQEITGRLVDFYYSVLNAKKKKTE